MSTLILTVATVTATQAHGGETAGLPQLDMSTWPSQLFWLTVTFGALFALMATHFLPRIGGMIEERRDRIADDLDQAAEFKGQAEDAQNAYEKELANARGKAQAIASDTRAGVGAEINTLHAEMEKTLNADIDAAEKQITAMKSNAAQAVREAAIDTTQAIVQALLDEAPSRDAATAAVDAVKI